MRMFLSFHLFFWTPQALNKLKFENVELSFKNLSRTSIGILEKYSVSRTRYNLRSIFGTERSGLNRWNHKLLTNISNPNEICARDFSSFKRKPKNISLAYKSFDQTHKQLRYYFSKHSFMTKCKSLHSDKPVIAIPLCSMISSSPCLSSYLLIKKCFLSSLLYHNRSISLKYQNTSSSARSLLQYSQDVSRNTQELSKKKISKRLRKSQRNKTSSHRGPCYPISLRGIYWRGFHSSLFLGKSESNKPFACKESKIYKSTEVKKVDEHGRKEKSDGCHSQKKAKCNKEQNKGKAEVRQKPKTEKIADDPVCKKCLPRGKCELPQTIPPSKMEYAKVTCPPPKLMKPKPCPSKLEYIQKHDKPHIETRQTNAQKKKQICVPPSMPKPPYAAIVLCPCPPPRKIHPGPCPYYKKKEVVKRALMQPCRLKKKYPCPTGVYYCSPQAKPCSVNQKTDCDRRKRKEAPARSK